MEYKRQYRDLPDEVKQKISASMKGRAKSYNEVLNLFRSVSVDYEADKKKSGQILRLVLFSRPNT